MASIKTLLIALLLLLSGLTTGLGLQSAGAETLESVLMPGKVIRGHAKTEDKCEACHVRFDREGQNKRCRDCHKDVGQDITQRQG